MEQNMANSTDTGFRKLLRNNCQYCGLDCLHKSGLSAKITACANSALGTLTHNGYGVGYLRWTAT